MQVDLVSTLKGGLQLSDLALEGQLKHIVLLARPVPHLFPRLFEFLYLDRTPPPTSQAIETTIQTAYLSGRNSFWDRYGME